MLLFLILVINQEHCCAAIHRGTLQESEAAPFKSVWDGPVEVFQLADHPKAICAYAWARREPELGLDAVVLLAIPDNARADQVCRIFNSP